MFANLKAFLTALSTIKDIFKMVGAMFEKYQENKRLKRKEEIKDSVDKAVDSKDQRDFEKQIGSDNAGKPTKHRLESIKTRPAKDRTKKEE